MIAIHVDGALLECSNIVKIVPRQREHGQGPHNLIDVHTLDGKVTVFKDIWYSKDQQKVSIYEIMLSKALFDIWKAEISTKMMGGGNWLP